MKKCILHIGCEKTASTSIQHAIYDNIKALRRRGFFSSWRMGYPNNRAFVAFFEPDFKDGHHNEWTKSNNINSQADRDKYFENFEEDFHKEILLNANRSHTCIISSEHFQSRVVDIQDIIKVRDVLYKSFEEVEIICYFREQYDRAIASWSTVIKIGWYASLEQYITDNCDLDNYAYNPMAMADRWSEVFGRKNCKFFIYDSEIDTVNHFFSAIDVDIRQCITETVQDRDEYKPEYNKNPSFYRLEAEAIRMINKKKHTLDGPGGTVDNIEGNQKARTIIRNSPHIFKYGAIKSNQKYDIREMFRSRNEEFLHKYFPGVYEFPTKKCIIPDPTPEQYATAYEEFVSKVLFTKTLDNTESVRVNLLRDSAYKLRDHHPKQAMKLLKHAIEFRPLGENLLKTLEQWEREDNIRK